MCKKFSLYFHYILFSKKNIYASLIYYSETHNLCIRKLNGERHEIKEIIIKTDFLKIIILLIFFFFVSVCIET